MWLWLQVFVVDDVLTDMFGENLIEHIVDREAQTGLVLQELLNQEGVKVVRVHHVVPATQHYQTQNTLFRVLFIMRCFICEKILSGRDGKMI